MARLILSNLKKKRDVLNRTKLPPLTLSKNATVSSSRKKRRKSVLKRKYGHLTLRCLLVARRLRKRHNLGRLLKKS